MFRLSPTDVASAGYQGAALGRRAVGPGSRDRDLSAAACGLSDVRYPDGPRVRERLLDAAGKKAQHPLVVFMELNLPPEDPHQKPSWVPHVNQVVMEIAAERGGVSPFSLVIFTNRPHLYGEVGEPDPARHVYALRPASAAIPESVADVLGEAATQYGNIPNDFPDGFK